MAKEPRQQGIIFYFFAISVGSPKKHVSLLIKHLGETNCHLCGLPGTTLDFRTAQPEAPLAHFFKKSFSGTWQKRYIFLGLKKSPSKSNFTSNCFCLFGIDVKLFRCAGARPPTPQS